MGGGSCTILAKWPITTEQRVRGQLITTSCQLNQTSNRKPRDRAPVCLSPELPVMTVCMCVFVCPVLAKLSGVFKKLSLVSEHIYQHNLCANKSFYQAHGRVWVCLWAGGGAGR